MADGSNENGSSDGDGVGLTMLEVGVGTEVGVCARPLPDPEAMPRSVANLYFLILALDMREVK